MSGGSGSLDAQYHPVPTSSPEGHNSGLYRPRRVEIDDEGKKRFIFVCQKCGEQFSSKRRRPRTYCSDKCRKGALGELGTKAKGTKRTPQERKNISKGQKKSWQNPETRDARVRGMRKNPRGKDKKKRSSKRKQYSRTCSQCGAQFSSTHKQQKYCSRQCAGKSQRKGEYHQCANPECSNKTYRKQHHIQKDERKYCSMDCAKSDPAYWEGVAKTKAEKYGRNWEWSGWDNERVDSKIWDPLAAKIREQDNNQCQSCMREWNAGEDRFPVHHILPRSQGGPDEEWNLMTLCPSCHPTTEVQKNAVKYPHEYQSKLEDFENPEGGSNPSSGSSQ